jgi:hypothetical protein
MTLKDWLWSALSIAAGIFIGSILGMLANLLILRGFWVIALLMLPLFLIQLAFEGSIAGTVALWRRWRGIPKPEPRRWQSDPDHPWLRRQGIFVGISIGIIYGFAKPLLT